MMQTPKKGLLHTTVSHLTGRVWFRLKRMKPKQWKHYSKAHRQTHDWPSLCLFLRGKLGALRLKVRLSEERILPSVYYQPLMELLVEAVLSPSEVHHTPAQSHTQTVSVIAWHLNHTFSSGASAIPKILALNHWQWTTVMTRLSNLVPNKLPLLLSDKQCCATFRL